MIALSTSPLELLSLSPLLSGIRMFVASRADLADAGNLSAQVMLFTLNKSIKQQSKEVVQASIAEILINSDFWTA